MMEVLNRVKNLQVVDEFLTFLGIYDDVKRERALKKLLLKEKEKIKGKTVVEAGAGFGIFSEWMKKLGARKVYAVESNPLVYEVLKEKREITPVLSTIEEFEPPEKIDILFHEFYGPMLYDESLAALERLKFSPEWVIPDRGRLLCGVVNVKDKVVKDRVLQAFAGVLITDLFPWIRKVPLTIPVAVWKYGEGLRILNCEVPEEGNFVVFGMEIWHEKNFVCSSLTCTNWPLVWTPRLGRRFKLSFEWKDGVTEVLFEWET